MLPLRDDAVGLRGCERAREVLNESAPALEDTQARGPLVGKLLDDGANHRVQARAVTAAGQQTDLHWNPSPVRNGDVCLDRPAAVRPPTQAGTSAHNLAFPEYHGAGPATREWVRGVVSRTDLLAIGSSLPTSYCRLPIGTWRAAEPVRPTLYRRFQ